MDGEWVETKDQHAEGEVRLVQLTDLGDGVFRDRSHRFLNLAACHRSKQRSKNNFLTREDYDNRIAGARRDLLISPVGQFAHVICWHPNSPSCVGTRPCRLRQAQFSASVRALITAASKTL